MGDDEGDEEMTWLRWLTRNRGEDMVWGEELELELEVFSLNRLTNGLDEAKCDWRNLNFLSATRFLWKRLRLFATETVLINGTLLENDDDEEDEDEDEESGSTTLVSEGEKTSSSSVQSQEESW